MNVSGDEVLRCGKPGRSPSRARNGEQLPCPKWGAENHPRRNNKGGELPVGFVREEKHNRREDAECGSRPYKEIT
jgi:hypothetical protein